MTEQLIRELKVGDCFYFNEGYKKYSLCASLPTVITDVRFIDEPEYCFIGKEVHSRSRANESLWAIEGCMDIPATNKLLLVNQLKQKKLPGLPAI